MDSLFWNGLVHAGQALAGMAFKQIGLPGLLVLLFGSIFGLSLATRLLRWLVSRRGLICTGLLLLGSLGLMAWVKSHRGTPADPAEETIAAELEPAGLDEEMNLEEVLPAVFASLVPPTSPPPTAAIEPTAAPVSFSSPQLAGSQAAAHRQTSDHDSTKRAASKIEAVKPRQPTRSAVVAHTTPPPARTQTVRTTPTDSLPVHTGGLAQNRGFGGPAPMTAAQRRYLAELNAWNELDAVSRQIDGMAAGYMQPHMGGGGMGGFPHPMGGGGMGGGHHPFHRGY